MKDSTTLPRRTPLTSSWGADPTVTGELESLELDKKSGNQREDPWFKEFDNAWGPRKSFTHKRDQEESEENHWATLARRGRARWLAENPY